MSSLAWEEPHHWSRHAPFTLSYIRAIIGHMNHLNLEEKSLRGELGAFLSLFAHKHFNYTTERVTKAIGAFISFLWSHTEQHYLILRAQFCFIYESGYFKEENNQSFWRNPPAFYPRVRCCLSVKKKQLGRWGVTVFSVFKKKKSSSEMELADSTNHGELKTLLE